MKYAELTINQRISLKGLFNTDPELSQYKAIWLLWDFRIAVEYFLNGDISILKNHDSFIDMGLYDDFSFINTISLFNSIGGK